MKADDAGRVPGLDGLRGLAAGYVLIYHCWLLSFRGYPVNNGPAWLGWAMYGRLAVVFFLVLSGFSLAVSAARNGWRLKSLATFARRRAWRIVPPYWAALLFSLVVAWAVVPASRKGGPPTLESVVVYGLLIQDIVPAATPNGAFWSIGVEAELCLLLPLLLLIRRRMGAVALLACVTVPVVLVGLSAPGGTPEEASHGLTLDLAPLFAIGVLTAGIVTASTWIRNLPWHWFAAVAAAPVLWLMVTRGSVWTVEHYFWIDLAIGPAMAMLVAAVATGRPAALVRLLTTRPLQSLGLSSYSLYLIHLPFVMVVARRFAIPNYGRGLTAFCVTFLIAVPISLLAARLFATVFELPFQRHRSWTSLAAAARARGTHLGSLVRSAAFRWPTDETPTGETPSARTGALPRIAPSGTGSVRSRGLTRTGDAEPDPGPGPEPEFAGVRVRQADEDQQAGARLSSTAVHGPGRT